MPRLLQINKLLANLTEKTPDTIMIEHVMRPLLFQYF